MPLTLIPPGKIKGAASYYIRGTYLRTYVFRSARTDRRDIAIKERQRIELEIEQGRFAEPAAIEAPTFLGAAAGYLKTCTAGEAKKVRRLVAHFKATPLSSFDKDAIDAAEAVLFPPRIDKAGLSQPYAAGTLNREYRAPLAAVLHHAAKRKLMPWLVVEKYEEKRHTAFLEPMQAMRLVRAARDIDLHKERHRDARLAPMLVFVFLTGARVSEACNLTWADVDLERRHVVLGTTKNGETYGVHLGDLAFEEIANLPGGRHPDRKIFGFRDRHAVKYSLHKARLKAKLPAFTFHQGRHSFATWLRRNGEDLRKIMELGRWKDVKSVMRYMHVASHEQVTAIAKLPMQPVAARKRKP